VIELSNAGLLVHHSARSSRRPGHSVYGQGDRSEPRARYAPFGAIRRSHHYKAGLRRTYRMDRSEEYMEKLLLSPEEAAEALGVGRSRVYDLIRTRQLLSVRIGKSRRVPVAAVHAYVERLTEQDDLV
jgi:excisionase family DNA binding protein